MRDERRRLRRAGHRRPRFRPEAEAVEVRRLMSLTAHPGILQGHARERLRAPVAQFHESVDSTDPSRAVGYTAWIDWGDGSAPEPAAIYLELSLVDDYRDEPAPPAPSPPPSPDSPVSLVDLDVGPRRTHLGSHVGFDDFTVGGTHVYARPGTYTAHVVLVAPGGQTSSRVDSTIVITAPEPSTLTLSPAPGPPIVGIPGDSAYDLAVLKDSDPHGDPEDYVVTIDWGDGTAPTPGQVLPWAWYDRPPLRPDADGVIRPVDFGYPAFSIRGVHDYAPGVEHATIRVTVTRIGGSTSTFELPKPGMSPPGVDPAPPRPGPPTTPAGGSHPSIPDPQPRPPRPISLSGALPPGDRPLVHRPSRAAHPRGHRAAHSHAAPRPHPVPPMPLPGGRRQRPAAVSLDHGRRHRLLADD